MGIEFAASTINLPHPLLQEGFVHSTDSYFNKDLTVLSSLESLVHILVITVIIHVVLVLPVVLLCPIIVDPVIKS